jgi:hypothetical protein
MSRVLLSIKPKVTLIVAALLLVSCTATKQIRTQANSAWDSVFGTTWSDEEIAWSDLKRNSSVRRVGDDRLIVDAWGALGTNIENVELRLLARAAVEVRSIGYTRFLIVHIRDRNMPVSGGLNPISIFGADDFEIGTYEDLVKSRYRRDYGISARNWWNPGVSTVIRALDAETAKDFKNTFDAISLYEYLNRKKMAK